jgi:hypothetical protein
MGPEQVLLLTGNIDVDILLITCAPHWQEPAAAVLSQVHELEQLKKSCAELSEQLRLREGIPADHKQLQAAVAKMDGLRRENVKLQKLKQQVRCCAVHNSHFCDGWCGASAPGTCSGMNF